MLQPIEGCFTQPSDAASERIGSHRFGSGRPTAENTPARVCWAGSEHGKPALLKEGAFLVRIIDALVMEQRRGRSIRWGMQRQRAGFFNAD